MLAFFIGVLASSAIWFLVCQKRVQKLGSELAEERRFRGAFESIPYYIAFDDKGAKDLYANPAACLMIGQPVGTPIAKEASHDAAHMEYLHTVSFPVALEKGVWIGETELLHADGHAIPVWQSVFPVRDRKGEIRGMGTLMRDITEEKAMRRMLDIQSSIVSSTTTFASALDNDLNLTYLNKGAYIMLGYEPEEVQLVPADIYDEEALQRMEKMRRYVQETHEHTKTRTHMKKKDGTIIHTENQYFPIKDEGGRFIGVGILANDITPLINMQTELLTAKEQAVAASEAKSDFLSNMSHEIRTPLNAILGMTELLSSEDLDERQQTFVKSMLQSGRSLLGLINDILDFSKIEAGQLSLSEVNYDLHILIDHLTSLFNFHAKEKGIAFNVTKEPGLPQWLRGDDLRVRQVLTNIIGNAIKFTAQGGVTLDVTLEDDYIVYRVTDTGVGIEAEDIPKLFFKFTQAKSAANRAVNGTGLGLAISKQLTEMMGGEIGLASQYGAGTIFTIKIPFIPSDGEEISQENHAHHYVQAPGAKVLVVDDNSLNLMVAAGLLEKCGIKADAAGSGAHALKLLERNRYDLVFMDHMMPGQDGIEVTGIIRQRGITPQELPIIALSANAIEGMRERYLEAGMQDFLMKPIEGSLLSAMLRKWLPPERIAPQ